MAIELTPAQVKIAERKKALFVENARKINLARTTGEKNARRATKFYGNK